MLSPAFPPRRPSHLIRYVFPAVLLMCLFYYLSRNPDPVATPDPFLSAGHGTATTHQTPLSNNPADGLSLTYPDSSHGATDTKLGNHAHEEKPVIDDTMPVHEEPSDKLPESTLKKPEKLEPPLKPEKFEKPLGTEKTETLEKPEKPVPRPNPHSNADHPIDELIRVAEEQFKDVMAKESYTISEAAQAYRKRRGRHPPPGFDTWFKFAVENDAIIVEDFFDQIYQDLEPFWGLEPRRIRKEAWDFEMTINVRNGNASAKSDWFWTQIWLDMFKTIEDMLPDMDVALNAMDEPRLVVPWEDITTYMQRAEQTRSIAPVSEVVTEFQKLPPPGKGDRRPATRKKYWEKTSPYWSVARRGCPPDSPARREPVLKSFNDTPKFEPSWAKPHQYQGYVSNFTLSKEFCHQPDLQGLEGIFINPQSTSATPVLFPMFGGSKLATNNEILLPAPMYWSEEERFTNGDDHGPSWHQKFSPVIWRGVATGGRNNESNWRGFQRHRFVSMNNETQVTWAEEQRNPLKNFMLPDPRYDIAAQKEGRLGEWISEWADVGFTDLMCDPDFKPKQEDGLCAYTDEHYEVLLGQSLSVQFYYKYLPDVDGNSFSGRYLGFLRSTSLPIKSTVWREWHDSRLFAWKHFVPMDNRFGDYYGIMEYFLGYGDVAPSHDAEAQKIATDGKKWAEKVLRREDMQIYVLRLLLEYARLSDDRREQMGWIDDLTT
ncbi:glycosyltransferase family 90 protein [Xylariomycetidae sp. FL0641]|nr:glycosyltransferase family 90 protein [Xylariomycetidae sp. FL0641]